ncbi:hypothetical protein [Pandoraea bronchicola]|uniref:Uncharacterized protein n=1 Tax=Pandoraea bronchicola TaxID=2508287 RepID=A0A5E5BY46_9BURK|nr:hypothetical protein [Pandoraea bronchicola]VVE90729.1 hypothetical protein PBR20603_04716 [Pandoraea bronchicola]
MNPAGIATIHTSPMVNAVAHQHARDPHACFNADIQTVELRAAGMLRSPFAADAVRIRHGGVPGHLPLVSVKNLDACSEPGPAADFAFFREPLKQNMALLGRWAAAARAGSQSEAWSRFVSDITEHFFKGSRRQRVMDALILSIDVLPASYRADALACLLADGEEGMAAAEEFWEYIGLDRIPEADKDRVRGLIRQYGIGA